MYYSNWPTFKRISVSEFLDHHCPATSVSFCTDANIPYNQNKCGPSYPYMLFEHPWSRFNPFTVIITSILLRRLYTTFRIVTVGICVCLAERDLVKSGTNVEWEGLKCSVELRSGSVKFFHFTFDNPSPPPPAYKFVSTNFWPYSLYSVLSIYCMC